MNHPEYLSEKSKLTLHQLPKFIRNWLVISLTVICLILLSFSFIVRFPVKISGDLVIRNTTPDIPVVAKKEGQLNLLVTNQEQVQTRQLIGYLQTAANTRHVLLLDSLLDQIFLVSPDSINYLSLISQLEKHSFSLGTLQNKYQQFNKRVKDLHYYSYTNNIAERAVNLERQKENVEREIGFLLMQRETGEEEVALSQENFEIDKKLHEQGVISNYDWNLRRGNFLSTKKQLQLTNFQLAENYEWLERLNFQIIELSANHNQRLYELEQLIRTDINLLKSSIDIWLDQNVFYATVSGSVIYAQQIESEVFVTAQQPLCYIVPESQDRIVGSLTVPPNRIGEIRPGQKVIAKLDGFPYEKYGVLYGEISTTLSKQEEDFLLLDVNLDQQLKSSTGHKFMVIQDMSGIGEIVLSNETIAQKVTQSLRKIRFQ